MGNSEVKNNKAFDSVILFLLKEGRTPTEIAQILNRDRATAYRWIQKVIGSLPLKKSVAFGVANAVAFGVANLQVFAPEKSVAFGVANAVAFGVAFEISYPNTMEKHVKLKCRRCGNEFFPLPATKIIRCTNTKCRKIYGLNPHHQEAPPQQEEPR